MSTSAPVVPDDEVGGRPREEPKHQWPRGKGPGRAGAMNSRILDPQRSSFLGSGPKPPAFCRVKAFTVRRVRCWPDALQQCLVSGCLEEKQMGQNANIHTCINGTNDSFF